MTDFDSERLYTTEYAQEVKNYKVGDVYRDNIGNELGIIKHIIKSWGKTQFVVAGGSYGYEDRFYNWDDEEFNEQYY